jgi:hypothetical protein
MPKNEPKNNSKNNSKNNPVWSSRQGCSQNTRLTGTLEFIRNAYGVQLRCKTNEGATLFV